MHLEVLLIQFQIIGAPKYRLFLPRSGFVRLNSRSGPLCLDWVKLKKGDNLSLKPLFILKISIASLLLYRYPRSGGNEVNKAAKLVPRKFTRMVK